MYTVSLLCPNCIECNTAKSSSWRHNIFIYTIQIDLSCSASISSKVSWPRRIGHNPSFIRKFPIIINDILISTAKWPVSDADKMIWGQCSNISDKKITLWIN